MSFAQGFQAGSAAVSRGLALKEKRIERERKEAYEKGLADLNQKYADSQQAQADFNAAVPVQQGAVASGPITSAAGLNPMAQAGIAAPADPNVQRTVTDVAAAPTGMGATPTGMGGPQDSYSFRDYQRDAAQLALSFGDAKTGLALMGQMQQGDQFSRRMDYMEDTADERFNILREQMAQQDEQFGKTLGLKEDQLEQLKAYQGRQMEQMTAQINDLTFRLEEGQKDARQRDNQRIGQQEFNKLYFDPSFTVTQGIENLKQQFTNDEGVLDEAAFNQAQGAAAKMYYEDYLKVDAATAGMVQASAVSKLDAAIARSEEPNLSDDDFINMFGSAIKEHVDPNFSDNISTELVAIKDDEGNNTGEFELRHGGQRVANAPRFSSRADVVKFAQAESDRLASSPFAVIEITENRKKSAAASAAALENYQDREKAYFEFMEANPHMMSRSLELKKLFNLGSGLSTDGTRFGGGGSGGGTPPPTSPGLASLQATRTAENEAESARIAVRDTAEQIVDMARNADELAQARALETPEVQAMIDQIAESRRQANQGLLRAQLGYGMGTI